MRVFCRRAGVWKRGTGQFSEMHRDGSDLFLVDEADVLFQLDTGNGDIAPAAGTLNANIRSDAEYHKEIASAGVRFFHTEAITY